MSVQEQFRNLLKGQIAPLLRAHGLKGSGQSFALPSASHWALIGIQKSTYSNAEQIKFTINLYVVSRSVWTKERELRSYFPPKPTANVSWQVGWSMRIGTLLPGGQDYWWSFDRQTDTVGLVQSVVDAIITKALPVMRQQMGKDA